MEEYFTENKSLNIKYAFGITIAQKGNIEQTQLQNDSLFAMAKRDVRFIPVCSVHPKDGDAAITELKRIKELGGKVIKLHPLNQGFDIISNEMIEVTRVAGELGLVVLVDGYGCFTSTSYLDELLRVAVHNNHTQFIIAHMGGSDFYKLGSFKLVADIAAKFDNDRTYRLLSNVWYDLSGTVFIYADSPYQSQLEWVMRSVGTDRILFGSDDPGISVPEALNAFYKLNLTNSEREKILYKNAQSLFDLP